MCDAGLAELLVVLAVVILVFGVRRLSSRPTDCQQDTRRALIVWLILVATGVSVWLESALRHP